MVQDETFDLCKESYSDMDEAAKLKPLSSKISSKRFSCLSLVVIFITSWQPPKWAGLAKVVEELLGYSLGQCRKPGLASTDGLVAASFLRFLTTGRIFNLHASSF